MWAAALANNAAECQDLLDVDKYGELGAQVDAKGPEDWTVLHLAAYEGFAEVCGVLLSSCSTAVNARTNTGRTALHLAAVRGSTAIVPMLMSAGADINAEDSDLCAPLHLASVEGHAETVKCLLAFDPDFEMRNCIKKTAYDLAANVEVSEAFEAYFKAKNVTVNNDTYTRTKFGSVLIRNSREDRIAKLLTSGKQSGPQALKILYETSHQVVNSSHSASPPDSPTRGTMVRASTVDRFAEAPVSYRDFSLIGMLGRGAFGEVYLVQKTDTGDQYAMKVLEKAMLLGHNVLRYARTERNVLSYLKHPFIVGLKFAFQTADKLVLMLDYCAGGDLRQVLQREHQISESRAKIYICEVLLALEALHSRDIIYRDLKPDNVVIDGEGHALLTDFGLSKEGMADNMLARSFCGSVAYLTPEVLQRKGHTKMVDFYLLGVLLYELLVGTPPFYALQQEDLFKNILSKKVSFPWKVSSQAKKLMSGLLTRDPTKRLGSNGTEEIKAHKFFSGVDWDSVYRRELQPPVPPIRTIMRADHETMESLLGTEEKPSSSSVPGWSFPETEPVE